MKVGLFVSNAFKFTPINLPSLSSFECISGKLECGRGCLNIPNIYRPTGPASSFFSELQDLLVYIVSRSHDLVLMGDFNLHLESSSWNVRQLTGILESFDLNQHVNFPTHIHGHSLDVMISSNRCDVLSVSPPDAISDHFVVVADLKIPTDYSHTVPQTITYRKLKAINMEAFKANINNSDLILKTLNPMPPNCLNNTTVSSALSSLSTPHLLPKRSPPNLLTRGWLLPSWLPKDIVDTLSGSGVDIQLL